jgi:hypothetical protein
VGIDHAGLMGSARKYFNLGYLKLTAIDQEGFRQAVAFITRPKDDLNSFLPQKA